MLPTPIAAKYVDQQSGYRVEDLVRLATERNRDLLAARQNVVIRQGRVVHAGLRPNPAINYDQTTDRGFGGEGEGGFGISYLHPIELGAKRDKRLNVARLELEQAQAELAFRERQLQVDTKSQFAEALAAVENLRGVERLRELDENMLGLTEARLAEGDAPKLDVNLVRVELNRLRAQQFQFENRLKGSLLRLRTLVGLDMDQELRLRGELRAQAVEMTAQTAERLAIENRQDLKAAKLAEEAAAADIRLANAQAVPDITPFVGYRRERSVFGAESQRQSFNPSGVASVVSLSDTDNLLNFGASLQLPLFNRNQGAKQEAGGRLAQARHAREFVEMVVRRDVEIALNRYQAARAVVDLFQTQILPTGRDNLQIVNALYMAGQQPIFEVVGEQRRFIDSQNLYVDALKDYYLSLVELERAIGRSLPGNPLSD
jgi:cobalt-zinc-cadmium efflux system outer membrane protein